VTQPQRYFANIARCLKHVHCAAVAQDMRRYRPRSQRRRDADSSDGVLFEGILETGARHHPASVIQEERSMAFLPRRRCNSRTCCSSARYCDEGTTSSSADVAVEAP